MADRVHSDFSEDDLECSSSSFEEDSGESSLDEEEDRLELRFQRPDVRPYQFEPARNVENGDVDESGSFRPRSSSPPRRFAPAAFRPWSFRPWSFRPLVVSSLVYSPQVEKSTYFAEIYVNS